MTPTEEIDKWIAEHGSERDALNIAIARLAALEPLETQHDAYFNINNGERLRLIRRANIAEAHEERLVATLKRYQYADGHFWHCLAHDIPGEPCEEFCRNAQAVLSASNLSAPGT